ncbi:MAG: DinB family protein [Chloroflexi bacterium]|nr:DinB family protein [Chloroflexota bacterium]
MLDFTAVRAKTQSWMDFARDLTHADLVELTDELAGLQRAILADCTDADVTFMPDDPHAHDPYAADVREEEIAWTLAHVILHATASSEESAFLAAELARGVPWEKRRSRYETPWETVRTIAQCRARIEESHRMIRGLLAAWPDEPHLDNTYSPREGLIVNPIIRHLLGMSHAEEHLEKMPEIVRQAQAAQA